MTTFTWAPSRNATVTKTPRIKSAKFGDGYEMRQADGINTILEIWNLTFNNRTSSEIDDIEDFLEAAGGFDYFEWTPPRAAEARKFICKSWTREIVTDTIDTLTATFEEVADA